MEPPKKRIIDKRRKEKFMVDDEYLNGMARLCGISATGVYFTLCRHADQGQECFPSNKLISEKLGISVRTVITSIQTLENRNVISVGRTRKKDGKWLNNTYTLLDKSEWDYDHGLDQVQNLHMDEPSANNDVSQVQPLHTKETHEKETHNIIHKNGLYTGTSTNNDIIKVMTIFRNINPLINYGHKGYRKAVVDLIREFGLEKVIAMAQTAVSVQGKDYAPTIVNPYQLREKISQLAVFVQRSTNNSSKIAVIGNNPNYGRKQ